MSKKHTEIKLEDAIEHCLISQHNYIKGVSEDYNPELGMEPGRIIDFIKKTQEKTWGSLEAIHKEATQKVILESLFKELAIKGTLKVLRYGFKCYGKKLKVAYFAPSNKMNPETLDLYKNNLLSLTRQLYYSSKNKNSLDMVIFLNGLPVITAELKNQMSGQTVEDAKKQYKKDRDPHELIFEFKKRTLVHFAVDPDLVFMTTRLSGDKTFFLPFNLGCDNGAGNPPNDNDYRTSYLWQKVLATDSLLDILGRFMHLQVEEKRILTDEGIKKISKETMIFPRFHQLDAVRKLVDHAKMNSVLDKAVGRYKGLFEEDQEKLKGLFVNFRNLYGFLSQVIPYQDSDLEQLYTYLRFLLTKLPRRASGLAYHFEDEVELQFYRLQKISEGQIKLKKDATKALKGPSEVGTGTSDDEEIRLSELIDILNDRFGTDFTQADQLFFDQIQEEAVSNKNLRKAAAVNSVDDFRYVFDKTFEGLIIERMEGNEEIFGKLMADSDFRKLVSEHLLHKVYNSINAPAR